MKKILTLMLCLMFLGVNASLTNEAVTPEQIKLADQNRADEKKEIKAVNKRIKKLKDKKKTEKNLKKMSYLKQQKADIKAKHNKIFESYLTDEQKEKLQQMKEDKKNGKSCCPCGKNPYY